MNSKYILGLVQGDGNFTFKIHKKDQKYLWIEPSFNISLHKNNENIIINIKNYFGIGYYRIDNKNICRYEINKINDIIHIIIPFFLNNKLKGNKYISFLIFKIILEKLYNKEHYINLSKKNNNSKIRFSIILLEIINMINHMNPINKNSQSKKNLWNFFNLNELKIVKSELIYKDLLNENIKNYPNNWDIDINYIEGLFDINGNISVYLEYNKLGNLRIRMTFNITQDIYNKEVLDLIQNYFKCGHIYKVLNTYKYDVKKIEDIKKKILPKFEINKIEKNNTINLYKLRYVKNILKIIENNGSNTIKSNEEYKEILGNMYNIMNNKKNIKLEKYVEEKLLNKKINKIKI